ncbi:hypothetical protein SLS62_008005 [Diatrype stigma]|uniref:Cytochrome P450 n=1 Tax=Diatrype stigma TaxID=117547 RepID=A0AAN9UMA5_9PEZI
MASLLQPKDSPFSFLKDGLSFVWKLGSMHLVAKSLHDKYGPIVRIAPNQLDLDCPSLIKTCFDRKGTWRKTEHDSTSGVLIDGKIKYNVFSETDPATHARMRKPVAKYYSMNGVLPFEPSVDSVLGHFVRQLDMRFCGDNGEMGRTFDIGQWILCCAWDMISKSTYGKRFGYLDYGYDFDGTMTINEKALVYFATIAAQPKLDSFLDKNRLYRIGPPTFATVAEMSLQHLIQRYNGEDKHDPAKPDFMDRFIKAKEEHPDSIDDNSITTYLLINMGAGADTTTVVLRSVFYLSLKQPSVWARLQAEVLAAPFAQKHTLNLPTPFAEARALPYLDAVIREACRLYPGFCSSMDRYVPEGGVHLPDGSFVPEGVAFGFNPYVIHRNKEIWGPDAEAFRPERWLRDEQNNESEDAYRQRLATMNNHDLTFGAGSRVCLGRNLAMLEVYKVVATLVALYEFELADPRKVWKVRTYIFPRQSGIEVRMRQRPDMYIREDVGIDE